MFSFPREMDPSNPANIWQEGRGEKEGAGGRGWVKAGVEWSISLSTNCSPLPCNAPFLRRMERLILTHFLLSSWYPQLAAFDRNGKEGQGWILVSEHLTFGSWLYSRERGETEKEKGETRGKEMMFLLFLFALLGTWSLPSVVSYCSISLITLLIIPP